MGEIGGLGDRDIGRQQIADGARALPGEELGEIAQLLHHVAVDIVPGHVDVLAFHERIERGPIGGEPEEPTGLQPLAPESPSGVLGAWIGNEPVDRGLVAGIGGERAIFGGGEQRLIGHRLPKVVREPRRNLVRREREVVLSGVDRSAVDLYVVEERRRQEQLGHRHAQHFDRRAHAVVERVKAGHLVGGQADAEARACPNELRKVSKQVWASGAVDAHAPPIAASRSGAVVSASPRLEATSKNAVMWLIEMRLSRPSNEALLSSGTAAS